MTLVCASEGLTQHGNVAQRCSKVVLRAEGGSDGMDTAPLASEASPPATSDGSIIVVSDCWPAVVFRGDRVAMSGPRHCRPHEGCCVFNALSRRHVTI